MAQLPNRGAQLLRQVLVEVQALERALLRRLHGKRRVSDHSARVLTSSVEELVTRHDRVQQPHLERALGRNEVGAQQELHCLGPRDLARQPHGRAAAREKPALGFHYRELGLRTRDADVAAPEHLHTARGTESVDRGHDGLVERPVAQHRARAVVESKTVQLGTALLGNLLLELRDLRHVLLEVGAREERLADTGDDGNPCRIVRREPLPRLP